MLLLPMRKDTGKFEEKSSVFSRQSAEYGWVRIGTDRYGEKTSGLGITPPYKSDQSDQSDKSVCADGVRSVQSTRTLFTV